jgi:hypothetical protein
MDLRSDCRFERFLQEMRENRILNLDDNLTYNQWLRRQEHFDKLFIKFNDVIDLDYKLTE